MLVGLLLGGCVVIGRVSSVGGSLLGFTKGWDSRAALEGFDICGVGWIVMRDESGCCLL